MKSLLIRGVRDSQCGFKCFTREAAQNIFSKMTCRNALFDMEAARSQPGLAQVHVAGDAKFDGFLQVCGIVCAGCSAARSADSILRPLLRWEVERRMARSKR